MNTHFTHIGQRPAMRVSERVHPTADLTTLTRQVAGHGQRPAMRVSERVHPTADLTPAPHKKCNKLLKFASYRCCCRCGLLNRPTRPDRRMLGCCARLLKFSTCRNISKACTGESAQSIPATAAAALVLVREPLLQQLLPHVPLITTCSIFLPRAAAAQPLAPSDVNTLLHQAH